ncbi:SLBB domain-containing protein [Cyclobacterium xiamenense]|uniref:SLBB domain-containing protein n=1 Tax=Cyclobacterium xiamenense TaxID=1297121 RepID=UPI001575D3E0|nr:SLBB domain-containing protein [Cyclobacterium xiamenense]
MQITRLFLTRFLLILVLLVHTGILLAQSLQDIQKVRADDLSDAQIEQLIKRAEASGMNEQQLIAVARERGLPMSEISKLQQRIASLRSGSRTTGSRTTNGNNQARQIGESENDSIFEGIAEQDPFSDLTPKQKQIFGYTLFYNRELNFNPSLNIPTPPDYIIGGGDQLLIDVYGASQQSYELTVNPEGSIFVPNIGPIKVAGATIAAATSRIKSAMQQIYSGLGGSDPNTFMELRLGNIRTVSVALVGELNQPGNYKLPSFASPFNALFAAGGPNENGSFRHIQVYRDNKLLTEIDVYDFLVKGEQSTTNTLRDNDVIIVPPVRNRVEVVGSVRRQGLFEIKSGENLSDLISYAGGFKAEAYKERVTLTRITASERKVEDVDADSFTDFVPQDGDSYRVGEILNRFINRVQVSGALMRPGTFSLSPDMKISDLIEKANGLREDAFLNRATLYRMQPDFSLEIISLDLEAIMSGAGQDMVLQREDVLHIASIYDIREEYFVKISGEVNNPGSFPFGENMTVADLVMRSGGFKESASASQIEIARRVKSEEDGKLADIIRIEIDRDLKLNAESAEMELLPFDHVIVRRSPGFQREKLVRVEGEVNYPGEYAISRANERISDLLNRSGGLNPFAYAKGATLIRRNEFYDVPSDQDIERKNLTSVRKNILSGDSDRSEFDKILLEKISEEIEEKEIDQADIEGNLLSDEFRKKTLETFVERDSVDFEIKTMEMVGIDLAAILRDPGGPNDLILQEGDVLSIPKELQTVRMRGEVLYPTSARYREKSGFKDYISRAGGFTSRSHRGRSYVVYANGDVQRTKRFLFINVYPTMEPGAEIIVPKKPIRESMSVQGWVGLATSLATLVILIDRLGTN